MAVINKITQKTENRFVNLYDLDVTHKNGEASHYYVASRARSEKDLKIRTGENHPDGVIIYSIYGPDKDKVVLIRQYRYPIGGYVYEFPAGLVERGENYREAAIREMHEETGLTFTPIEVDPMYEEPRFTTVGMTDESCATVYGYSEGQISDRFLEDSVVTAKDRSATASWRTAKSWRSSWRTATKSGASSRKRESRSCARTSSCTSLWMRSPFTSL